MKNETVFFTSKTVTDFLLQFGKGSQSKDYEFLTALLLKNFCEKQFGERCEIGFKLKPEYLRHLPSNDTHNLSQVAKIFREGIEESNSIDCIIATEESATTGKRQGLGFQLKRFGIGRKIKNTFALINYLNKLNVSYAKSDETLLIILDIGVEVELPKVQEALKIKTFPFSRLMFSWMEKDKLCIGELYPQYGMEEYNLADMIN